MLANATVFEKLVREFGLDNLAYQRPPTPEEELKATQVGAEGRSDGHAAALLVWEVERPERQRCGRSTGYSLSVAENTKQRIWKSQVRIEFERLRHELVGAATEEGSSEISTCFA